MNRIMIILLFVLFTFSCAQSETNKQTYSKETTEIIEKMKKNDMLWCLLLDMLESDPNSIIIFSNLKKLQALKS